MYRSASWSRDSDEYFKHGSSPSTKELPSLQRLTPSFESNELPVYDPLADQLAKKERARVKFAENAVHVIPFVLLLCAIILWFFSNPVYVGIKGDSVAARIEGLTLEGEFDSDSDGTQTGVLPILDLGDMDSPKQLERRKESYKLTP